MGSVGYGIGASNLCVIISASSNLGLTTPLCLIVFGLSTFLINFNSVNYIEKELDFELETSDGTLIRLDFDNVNFVCIKPKYF
jgi:hypothetical protein